MDIIKIITIFNLFVLYGVSFIYIFNLHITNNTFSILICFHTCFFYYIFYIVYFNFFNIVVYNDVYDIENPRKID